MTLRDFVPKPGLRHVYDAVPCFGDPHTPFRLFVVHEKTFVQFTDLLHDFCPYQQRTYYRDDKKEYFPGQGMTELELMGGELYPLQPGTVVKCNFCIERIDQGLARGLRPGLDREATPVCVNACPTKARTFGDLDDPVSDVCSLINQRRGIQLHPEYGTDPSVYYLIR